MLDIDAFLEQQYEELHEIDLDEFPDWPEVIDIDDFDADDRAA